MKRCFFNSNNTLAALFLVILGIVLPSNSYAAIQQVTLPSGYVASAEYRPSNSEQPAVLVLHGFLSTRNFLTVSNLTNALADEGYSVLAPNLTLGVNLRKVSLPCEAIHTHTLYDDIKEIDYWVDWLIKQGHKEIVIVGHSYGSLHGLLYLQENKNPAVTKLIATSLVDVEHVIGDALSKSQIQQAQQLLDNKDNSLKSYQVSYCKKYVAPPAAFLSYATWSKQNILNAIARTKISVEVILGSADTRMGDGWPELLQKSGVKLQIIPGANHFFHNEKEFDLLDSVLAAISSRS